MNLLKEKVEAFASKIGIAKIKGKYEKLGDWLHKAGQGKSQKEVLELLDLYSTFNELNRSLINTTKKLKAKKVTGPEKLILKGYTFFEIYDSSLAPCGVPRLDKNYKDFLIGYADPIKPPDGFYTKVLPTIISELNLFKNVAHVIGYLKYLLKKGLDKSLIRRMMKSYVVGRENLNIRCEKLKNMFCVKDGAGIRGLVIYPSRVYRIKDAVACYVAGESGHYAKMVRI